MIARMMTGVLLSVALTMGGGTVFADENRFAVVTVNNNTKDVNIHFSYRWGDGEWKELKNLKPGRAEWFAIPLNDKGGAPRFQIRINEAVGAALPITRTFNLKWKPAPDRGVKFGHQFEIVRDKSNNDYVSVYDQEK
ncbi:MAG: hypothetical protein EBV06_13550 [Planctomycetia bacterium]|nr:hypothetical protein [Planctomycetia bacterium]